MQKIEKWRIQELALILKTLTDLMRKSNNSDWAGVFSHFHMESQEIILKDKLDIIFLNNLIKNIKNCYSTGNSFLNFKLEHEISEEMIQMNQDFRLLKALLFKSLSDMEQKMIEHIN